MITNTKDIEVVRRCRVCDVILTDENWYPSYQKAHANICKKCSCEHYRLWREANPDKTKAMWTRAHRVQGQRPMSENKECSAYLGVHIAEQVLCHIFNDVEVMPYGNSGFDFICNKGKNIDVKSSCRCIREHHADCWMFGISHNTTADYFLCIAFDNRDNLNPVHLWLIPGHILNHLRTASITISTLGKWSEYELTDKLDQFVKCCDSIR